MKYFALMLVVIVGLIVLQAEGISIQDKERMAKRCAVADIVRVYHTGQWRTVCHDDFDMRDTKVACRQLGFIKAVGYWYLGRGSGKVWLAYMRCTGTETSLQRCSHNG
ncbi:hypothetical protein QZH41_010161 [Actinostola sp. cb2023]|nr:hypothetical protein QZH41_010161 [Actinostola sp. cb2023]